MITYWNLYKPSFVRTICPGVPGNGQLYNMSGLDTLLFLCLAALFLWLVIGLFILAENVCVLEKKKIPAVNINSFSQDWWQDGGGENMAPLGNRTPGSVSQAIFFHILTLIGRQLGYLFFYSGGGRFWLCFEKYAQHPHTFFSWFWSFVLLRTFRIGHGRIWGSCC